MTKRNCYRSTHLTGLILFALVLSVFAPIVSAQTPGVTVPSLTSSGGTNSNDDDLLNTFSLTGSATTSATAWYRDGVPIMSLYMPFEGGATSALADYSGNGGAASTVGGPAWSSTAGYNSTGAYVLAAGNYINAGNKFPTSSSYTTTAWFNRSTTSGTAFIVGSSTASHGLRVTFDGLLGAGHNGNWRIVQSNVRFEITANTWFFAAVTYDAETGEMILYRNGQPIDSGYATPGEMNVTDPSVQIGALQGATTLAGSIDNVRIYGEVLSPEEIALLFTSTGQNEIVAINTNVGETWQTMVTPFSSTEAGATVGSNTLTIVPTAPGFTSTPKTTGIAGKNYYYPVHATGGPTPTYAVTSGPAGLTVDSVTGEVTWVPSTDGSYPVTLEASNSQGTDLQSFSIIVAAPSVGVSNVALTTLPGGDLQASNDLTLGATSDATAWYRDGNPVMSLYMPFEGGDEYSLEDYSGHGAVATKIGTNQPVFLPTGGHDGNGAMSFGNGGFLNVGNVMPTHSSYSKTVWFYHTQDREFQHLLSGWDHTTDAGGGHGLRVSLFNRLGAGQDGKWNIVESATNSIAINQWYFGAVTFDYNTGEMILYLDGVPVDSAVVAVGDRDVTDASCLVGSTRGDFTWSGTIDDARIYSEVLSPEQITSMYSTGGDKKVVANETQLGEVWETRVTGFSAVEASVPFASNTVTVGSLNEPPVLAAIGPHLVDENQTLMFTVSATDPDTTIPALSATPLPPNAAFVDSGNGTGLFTFTPSYAQSGVFNITFIADDGEATDNEIVTITVNNVNRLPVLAAIGPKAVNENDTLTFTVSGSDPDGSSPALLASPLPANASFVDSANGVGLFTFVPSFDQAGLFAVTFVAADGEAADSELVNITVNNVNRAPVLASVGPQMVDEGVELVIHLTATDPDGDTPIISSSTLPTNAMLVDSGNGAAAFHFAPSYLQSGVYDIWFRALDPGTAGDSELVQITVIDVPQSGLWTATIHAQGTTVGTAVSEATVQIGVQLQSQQTPASPPPPDYTTQLLVRGPGGEGPYYRDISELGDSCFYWTIELDPHGTANPPASPACATLSWDPNEFNAENNYVLREGLDPNGPVVVADMRTTTSYQVCDVQTSRFYTVHWESTACAGISYATLSLTAGWNLVSLPVIPESNALADLFPTAEAAFAFDGTYSEATTLDPCVGYWVKVPTDVTVSLTGTAVTDCATALTEGWHLVGGPNCTAAPITTPGGALQTLFGFDGSYQSAVQTAAGMGYWAEISPAATLTLNCGAPAPPAASLASDGSRLVILASRPVTGLVSSASVELGADMQSTTAKAPPEAPEYSVRMKLYREDMSAAYYRDVRSTDETENLWILAVNPHGNDVARGTTTATISWDPAALGHDSYELRAGLDGTGEVLVADMKDVTSFEITGDNRDQFFSILRSGNAGPALPDEFTLNQNYPNPFNPTTQISFSLPTARQIRLDVFNVLGQRVATLFDGNADAGEHTVTWEAKNSTGQSVSSGVYFYRLEAAGFSQTRKMMLLR
jgi:hypothetical protein